MLNDSSANARTLAAMQLAEKGDDQDARMIEKLLNDSDPDVRIAAAFALLLRARQQQRIEKPATALRRRTPLPEPDSALFRQLE